MIPFLYYINRIGLHLYSCMIRSCLGHTGNGVLFHRIRSFHVTVKEINNKVLFLRKLASGGTEHSFGIHVARMAGMPIEVLNRASEILKKLEGSQSKNINKSFAPPPKDNAYQLSFIHLDDPLLLQIKEDILNINIETLTPVEALMKLNEIKKLLN